MTSKTATKQAPELKSYKVTVARFIGGIFRQIDETIEMTPKAARYYMPPHGVGLELDEGKVKAAPKRQKKVSDEAPAT